MAITIDTTVSGTNANSYATIVEADAYFEANIAFFPIWSAMAESEKSARLVRAAQAINRMSFLGSKYYWQQAMEFPRYVDRHVLQRNGVISGASHIECYFDDTAIVPERVKHAQLEMLLHHYADQDASTGKTSGAREISSVNVDQTASVQYSDAPDRTRREAVDGGSIDAVIALLRPWLLGDGLQIDSTFEVVR